MLNDIGLSYSPPSNEHSTTIRQEQFIEMIGNSSPIHWAKFHTKTLGSSQLGMLGHLANESFREWSQAFNAQL